MDLNDEIAVFKYGIISVALHNGRANQAAYFREAARIKYNVPGKSKPVKYNWQTFKQWLRIYRKYGYDGLKPSFRKDKGKTRKIDAETQEAIKKLYRAHNYKTVSNFYRCLLASKIISVESFSEVTLRNYLKANNITFEKDERKGRKAFEARHINLLWTADFMHGPYVRNGKKKTKSYLCAIIDDHSRLLVGGMFFHTEDSLSLQITLKQAVMTYGLPQKLYCDNGQVFSSNYLHMVCARLGIALIHSKPYDSPSRGKIERVFRTVRDMFLPNITYNSELTLDSLNQSFKTWLQGEYHHKVHSTTGETPMNRYINDIPNVKRKEISESESDKYFYQTIYRTVKNDSTVTIDNIVYEVHTKYIGKKVEIRFPLDNREDLRLFEEGKQVATLKELDRHFNSENVIKYHSEEDENV